MRNELERLHKVLGAVCGEIVIALTIFKLTGGRATLQKWLKSLAEAQSIIEKMLEK